MLGAEALLALSQRQTCFFDETIYWYNVLCIDMIYYIPICHREHNSLCSVVFTGINQCSTRDRCTCQQSASESPLCINSNSPDTAHTSQSQAVASQDLASGPKMPSIEMVSHVIQSIGWRPVALAR